MAPLRRSLQKERRILERRQPLGLLKKLYIFDIERIIMFNILLDGEVAEEYKEEKI